MILFEQRINYYKNIYNKQVKFFRLKYVFIRIAIVSNYRLANDLYQIYRGILFHDAVLALRKREILSEQIEDNNVLHLNL